MYSETLHTQVSMTTNQLGESQHCDACHDFQARCLIFIRPPLVSPVPVQWDQDSLPKRICILLLFGICCCVSLCLQWLDFLQRWIMRALTQVSPEPSSVLNEAAMGQLCPCYWQQPPLEPAVERAVQFSENAVGCQGLCSHLHQKWYKGTMLHWGVSWPRQGNLSLATLSVAGVDAGGYLIPLLTTFFFAVFKSRYLFSII